MHFGSKPLSTARKDQPFGSPVPLHCQGSHALWITQPLSTARSYQSFGSLVPFCSGAHVFLSQSLPTVRDHTSPLFCQGSHIPSLLGSTHPLSTARDHTSPLYCQKVYAFWTTGPLLFQTEHASGPQPLSYTLFSLQMSLSSPDNKTLLPPPLQPDHSPVPVIQNKSSFVSIRSHEVFD